jgi:hypothetical protein
MAGISPLKRSDLDQCVSANGLPERILAAAPNIQNFIANSLRNAPSFSSLFSCTSNTIDAASVAANATLIEELATNTSFVRYIAASAEGPALVALKEEVGLPNVEAQRDAAYKIGNHTKAERDEAYKVGNKTNAALTTTIAERDAAIEKIKKLEQELSLLLARSNHTLPDIVFSEQACSNKPSSEYLVNTGFALKSSNTTYAVVQQVLGNALSKLMYKCMDLCSRPMSPAAVDLVPSTTPWCVVFGSTKIHYNGTDYCRKAAVPSDALHCVGDTGKYSCAGAVHAVVLLGNDDLTPECL